MSVFGDLSFLNYLNMVAEKFYILYHYIYCYLYSIGISEYEKVKIDDDIKFVKYHKKEKTVAKVPKRTVIKSLSQEKKIKLSYNK